MPIISNHSEEEKIQSTGSTRQSGHHVGRSLTPGDHFVDHRRIPNDIASINNDVQYLASPEEHRVLKNPITNMNEQPRSTPRDSKLTLRKYDTDETVEFRGGSTLIFTEDEIGSAKASVVTNGLENISLPDVKTKKDENGYGKITNLGKMERMKQPEYVDKTTFGQIENEAVNKRQISPLQSFTRMYADTAHTALITSYNRFKLPIADIEHRKAFRHIFITRPECYIMGTDGISQQVLLDPDMAACYARFPHVLRALSPVYVCHTPGTVLNSNWNYLLCNRVQGLTTSGMTLNVLESMTSAIRGATVTPGTITQSNNGGTLDLSFVDTKYLDVYEMLRMWMLYIHKRRTGEFFPSFNDYKQQNSWGNPGGSVKSGNLTYRSTHPYDRALDYCASLFDIVTDETGTRIIYWCKYYGIFPVSASNGMLTNDKNGPLTNEATITSTFRYQYRLENNLKTLQEFNFNAGIANSLGDDMVAQLTDYLAMKDPFTNMNGQAQTRSTSFVGGFRSDESYGGAHAMFTGSPYIIKFWDQSKKRDPWDPSNTVMFQAALGFMQAPVATGDMMNAGI